MAVILSCPNFDSSTNTCLEEVWIDQPGLLPPLPADQGLVIAGSMITVAATAWAFKAIRRFIWPKA
jgi:hypothetical protein